MTRKDYEAFAEVFRKYTTEIQALAREGRHGYGGPHVLTIAGEVANIFAADNPRFDRERFLKACEPREGDN
jgi:hypothetical protein